ncbi:MAG: hypothetical protein JKY70_12295, partial [Mucilaginibacter sp.]|nr:hypothetical protein [Mucilaginibacter sp.]
MDKNTGAVQGAKQGNLAYPALLWYDILLSDVKNKLQTTSVDQNAAAIN